MCKRHASACPKKKDKKRQNVGDMETGKGLLGEFGKGRGFNSVHFKQTPQAGDGAMGNYEAMDQRLALQWKHDWKLLRKSHGFSI